jgi:PAS domain S-box-containing protein
MKITNKSNRNVSTDSTSKNSISLQQEEKCSYHENHCALFEQATDAIMITDFKGNFKDVNSSLCALFGYTKEELLQINVRTLLDEEHLANHPLRFDLLAKGVNIFNERKMVHKSGAVIYMEANVKKVMDDRIMVITRDITERKKAEQVLQKSEANLHTIFDTTDTIYVLIDTHFRIISYNPRAADFVRIEFSHEIEISEYFLDYFPPAKQQLLENYMHEVLSGKSKNYEACYHQPGGLVNWYYVRMFPISRGNGPIYGIMYAVSDITEKKLLEDELVARKVQEQKNIIRAVLKAQEIERNKLSQELHDNVNQILACVRLYLNMIEKDPSVRKDLITKSKELIELAVGEIRLLCKEQVMPPKTFNLRKLINELICNMNANSKTGTKFRSDVAIHLEIDEDLKLNIYRIVQEQINNILKHSGASEAYVGICAVEKNISVMITDNGRGFDPEIKRKGIGIINMINRVESYNGHLVIDSNQQEGCRIKIIIPLEQ